MDTLVEQFKQALLSFDRIAASELIQQAEKSEGAAICIEKIIVPSLIRIGEGWENESVALSQVYMSGRICEELIDTLLPSTSPSISKEPSIAIVLLDDYHALGKRIIYSVLKASGLNVADWGRLDAKDLVTKVIDSNIQILLISVLMLPSALRIKTVIERFKQQKVKIKIVVGGAPFRFDNQLAKEVGADATGKNASEAIKVVNRIIKELS